MKIKKIFLENVFQFKKLELDFTYPKDHVRAGDALDKICIIGQSGTGKSLLLKFIKRIFISNDKDFESSLFENKDTIISVYVIYNGDDYIIEVSDNRKYKITLLNKPDPQNDITKERYLQQYLTTLNVPKVIYYPAEMIYNDSPGRMISGGGNYAQQGIYVYDSQIAKRALDLLLNEIKIYREKETNFRLQLSQKILDSEQEALKKELNLWLAANPNPVEELAEKCLDKILNKLHLETRRDLKDTRDKDNLQIQKRNSDTIIPFNSLSTGTKQVIVTAIPLYVLKPDEALVLFDEPERSLFPDVQRDLVYYYQNLAPSSQFFFATHSPLIASQFAPDERFILKFNEEGNIECTNGIVPEGDDPNDILFFDFKMPHLLTKKGEEEYSRYLGLKNLIRNEKDEAKKEELVKEYMEIGNQFNFFREDEARYKKE